MTEPTRHQDQDQAAAWRRAQRGAWALTAWRIGYDRTNPPRDARTPTAVERHQRWIPASAVLALACWRAAADTGVPVDDVPLLQTLPWLDGHRAAELHTTPYPAPPPPAVTGGWTTLVDRADELADDARDVITRHVLAHDADDLADPDGPLFGPRVHAVESEGLPQTTPPWQPAIDYAREQTSRLEVALTSGTWQPAPAVQASATTLLLALRADPDTPAIDTVDEPTWLQRLCRTRRWDQALRDALRALPGTETGGLDPYRQAVGSMAAALSSLPEMARTSLALWEGRGPGIGIGPWERGHIPRPLRAHIQAAEQAAWPLREVLYVTAHPEEAWY